MRIRGKQPLRYCEACAPIEGAEPYTPTRDGPPLVRCDRCERVLPPYIPSEGELLEMFRDVWISSERGRRNTYRFFTWVDTVAALGFVAMAIWFALSPVYNNLQVFIVLAGAATFAGMAVVHRRTWLRHETHLDTGPPL